MDKKIEMELLNTKNYDEFREVIKKYNITSLNQLSIKVLEHHCNMGLGDSSEKHIDPRLK